MTGKTLVEGVDYEWEKTLDSDGFIDVGEHWVDLIGAGDDYTGLVISATFYIDPADVAQAVVQGIEDKVYTGEPITQTPTLVLGDYVLVEGVDYDVAYSNNVEVGTATVIFTGKGNFVGERSVTFQIGAEVAPAPAPVPTPSPAPAPTPSPAPAPTPTSGKANATTSTSTTQKTTLAKTGDSLAAAPLGILVALGAAGVFGGLRLRRKEL